MQKLWRLTPIKTMDYKTGYAQLPPTPVEQLLRLPCGTRVQGIMDEMETIRDRRNVLGKEFASLCKEWLPKPPIPVIEHKVRKVRVAKDKVVKEPRKSRLTLIPLED